MKKPAKFIAFVTIALVALLWCTLAILDRHKKTIHALPALLTDHNHIALQQIGAKAISPYSYPVALSPGGNMLLVKTKTIDSFALTIYKNSHIINKLPSKYGQWEITWDPSGKCIAYLAEGDIPGKYLLNLWWIDTNTTTLPSVPATDNASFPVRWSPDGHGLAYIECNRPTSNMIILRVNHRSIAIENSIPDIDPESSYAWSPDSKYLVFSITKRGAKSIVIYNCTNNQTQKIVPLGQSEIKDLNWAPSQFVAAALRLPHDKFYRLAGLSASGDVYHCAAEDGDVKTPVKIDGTRVLTYVLEKETQDGLWSRSQCLPPKLITSLQAGSIRIQNDGYKHLAIPVIESGPDGPPVLSKLGQQALNPFPTASDTDIQKSIDASHIWIKNNNDAFPAWLWTNNSTRNVRAIVFVHGGTKLHESGSWEPLRQAFAKNGFTVLAPNYSGSSGYGAKFEQADILDLQTKELIASVRYLEKSGGIKKQNIIILASSRGTKILIEALRQEPELCGMVVFESMLAQRNHPHKEDSPVNYKGTLVAFHGSRDSICRPKSASSYLNSLFAEAIKEHRLYWRVFDNESHDFSRISSLQEIYGTIICTTNSEKTN